MLKSITIFSAFTMLPSIPQVTILDGKWYSMHLKRILLGAGDAFIVCHSVFWES